VEQSFNAQVYTLTHTLAWVRDEWHLLVGVGAVVVIVAVFAMALLHAAHALCRMWRFDDDDQRATRRDAPADPAVFLRAPRAPMHLADRARSRRAEVLALRVRDARHSDRDLRPWLVDAITPEERLSGHPQKVAR
jgi:hypothetical protein